MLIRAFLLFLACVLSIGTAQSAYAYDGLNRLKTASGPWGLAEYDYDALNNLMSKQLGTRNVSMQYDGRNRLLAANDSTETGPQRSYQYDARGNVTHDGRIAFAYDFANQPVAMSGAGTDGAFVYDGNYKRVKQVINGETIYTVYSLSGAILYRDNATTGIATDYLRMGGKTIARIKGADEVSYLHQDHLGSPVAATDETGAVLWRESYTPFGESLNDPLANKDNENFTGHVRDAQTGLIYMQARYMDPVVGRFLSNDPVGFASGGVDYFNRYAYTANDPVNNTDPDGRFFGAVGKLVKFAVKGGDLGATFAGAAQDVGTLTSGSSTGLQRLGAAASLATEVFSPVSARDAKAGVNAIQSASSARKANNKPDFIVNSDGAVVRNSPSGARADLEAGGLQGQPITNRSSTETGTLHNNPAQGTDIRIMDGGANHPPRAVTNRQGSSQGVNAATGENFGNVPRTEQRQRSHIELDED